MDRTYSAAVAALNTLQSNFATLDAIRKSGQAMNRFAIPEMIEWCEKIGYQPADFDRIRPVHIAGTKGKGSTSAFVSSILAQYLPQLDHGPETRPCKIGLYTSPHLRFVRERIQINNRPLSEELFTRYFFEVWDRLEASAQAAGLPIDTAAKPSYFRYLTLMAFHAYMSENVDTAVIECGVGGEYDSTNILVKPTVTGISSLGIDHTAVLGNTIEEIAWHKAGIFKPGAAAWTVPQPASAMEVLRRRAQEKNVNLRVAHRHPDIDNIRLGLAADFQKTNASLAIELAAEHLRQLGYSISTSPLPSEFRRGLAEVSWGGRCEVRKEQNIIWHIDGGHTLESIEAAGTWFAEQVQSDRTLRAQRKRLLIFNQQTRDAKALANALYETLAAALGNERPFTHAAFCTNITRSAKGTSADLISLNTDSEDVAKLGVQTRLAQAWADIDGTTEVTVIKTIEEAIQWARSVAADAEEPVMALVTGSLHLVGGFIDVLETEKV